MSKLKRPTPQKGSSIKAPADRSEPSDDKQPPLFCFQFLQRDFCISDCEKDEKAALADKLREISQLSWEQLRQSPRHGMGYEIIKRNEIRPPIPQSVTEDVHFIAFRFNGKAPMIGYRQKRVFHVLWIDRNFTCYQH